MKLNICFVVTVLGIILASDSHSQIKNPTSSALLLHLKSGDTKSDVEKTEFLNFESAFNNRENKYIFTENEELAKKDSKCEISELTKCHVDSDTKGQIKDGITAMLSKIKRDGASQVDLVILGHGHNLKFDNENYAISQHNQPTPWNQTPYKIENSCIAIQGVGSNIKKSTYLEESCLTFKDLAEVLKSSGFGGVNSPLLKIHATQCHSEGINYLVSNLQNICAGWLSNFDKETQQSYPSIYLKGLGANTNLTLAEGINNLRQKEMNDFYVNQSAGLSSEYYINKMLGKENKTLSDVKLEEVKSEILKLLASNNGQLCSNTRVNGTENLEDLEKILIELLKQEKYFLNKIPQPTLAYYVAVLKEAFNSDNQKMKNATRDVLNKIHNNMVFYKRFSADQSVMNRLRQIQECESKQNQNTNLFQTSF